MKKFFGLIGSTIGGGVGWAVGAKLGGTMTAFMLSIVGTGLGIYFAKKYADSLES